jgi:hypothetical protein
MCPAHITIKHILPPKMQCPAAAAAAAACRLNPCWCHHICPSNAAVADDDLVEDIGMTAVQLLSPANKAKLTLVSLRAFESADNVSVTCWQHASAA